MYEYKAPIRDTKFVCFELFGFEEHYQDLNQSELNQELLSSILEEAAKFAESELAPLNLIGDTQGCQLVDGKVKTPSGFKEAWNTYNENGWPGLEFRETEGGQGLPESVRILINEYFGTANWAWNSLIGFGAAGSKSLRAHANETLAEKVIPKYAAGEAMGTMCLTEPHCGTDLGLLRTKARENGDGTYAISGTKIFITSGDHDLTDNIIHLVLARIEGAPAGTKGISLFVVPKQHLDGPNVGEPNGVTCGALEKKMGIKGSSTCVMNFDDARAYLVGEPNRGLAAMFPMMNAARIGTGQQGLCHAEIGLQKSAAYAKDRLQMRSSKTRPNENSPADPIIVHPDVRRMLLTQKAIAEGGRMMVAYSARLVDQANDHPNPETRASAEQQLSFLTPIIKAFLSELGFESANLAMQCFGGHGYIHEWGVEQNVRDARIAMLYEGTTGIQALDLLGRKVLGSRGTATQLMVQEINDFCTADVNHEHSQALKDLLARIQSLTIEIGEAAAQDPDEIGSASVDYLMIWGYTLMAYFWALAARKADSALKSGTTEEDFYSSKMIMADFYFGKILPRIMAHEARAKAGAALLMEMSEDQFLAHIG